MATNLEFYKKASELRDMLTESYYFKDRAKLHILNELLSMYFKNGDKFPTDESISILLGDYKAKKWAIELLEYFDFPVNQYKFTLHYYDSSYSYHGYILYLTLKKNAF